MAKNNFSQQEEKIIKFWQEKKIFQKTLDKKPSKGDFIFYDGPPFATGLPHYGHIIASAMKDIIPRYQTMCGKKVKRRWGWDCHGLPIENLIEKEFNLSTKKEINSFGIEKFNKACADSVLRYADYWQKFIPRIGRWVNMQEDYKTMNSRYIEVIWWVFKELYKDKLIYQNYKPMHLCPRCETTLSNFEVTQGYKEVKDISVYVKFQIKDFPYKKYQILSQKALRAKYYLLAWTTTPWTLPGNMALAVGKKIKYQILKIKDDYYVIAKNRVKEVLVDHSYKVVQEIVGSDLIGLKYKFMFDFAVHQIKKDQNAKNAFQVYPADFVSTEDGTGIVHIAPAFGEDDYHLSKKHKIPFLQHVKTNGTFKGYVAPWAGKKVKPKENPLKTDIEILRWLIDKDLLFKKENIKHSYPHCWRCDTPLLNYLASSWFVKVTALKDRLLAANQKINWVPKHLKNGRFGKWLEGARDWAISRSRYWGAPLPVWQCSCGQQKIIGSKAELGQKIKDLHRPYIDKVRFKCSKCGKNMERIPEVFDCWFESGSMPYASEFMFSDYDLDAQTSRSDLLQQINFPADFIAEGIDQTRGWFYTLLVLGVALYDKSPFKNVIVNGVVLAENGQKMSKRLKNYPDPMELVAKYGADSLRFYLMSSPAVRGESLNFSEKGVDEVYKKLILLSLNILRFWKIYYKNSKLKIKMSKLRTQEGFNILDKWILARLNQLIAKVTKSLDNYQIDKACRPIIDFVNDLSTWYLRCSRNRFKGTESKQVIKVLGYVLQEFAKVIAPVCPFLAEHLYQNVNSASFQDQKLGLATEEKLKIYQSVHLEKWPEFSDQKIKDNQELLNSIEKARQICEIGHSLRDQAGIKLRQPLRKCQILNIKYQTLDNLLDLIKDELNVKNIEIVKKLPKGKAWINKDGVALFIEIDQSLKQEGLVRELTRKINYLRKKQGLTINDQVFLEYNTESDQLKQTIKKYQDKLKQAVLAKQIDFNSKLLAGKQFKIDGNQVLFNIKNDKKRFE